MLYPAIYSPGTNGVPSSTVFADLRGRIDSYEHTICAGGGFETCTIKLTPTLAEGLDWLNQLMAALIVYDADGLVAFEGYLNSVELTAGQECRTRTLDDLYNRVRVRFVTDSGVPSSSPNPLTAPLTDSASVARYGAKDLVMSGSSLDSSEAAALAAVNLAKHKQPRAAPASTVATGALGSLSLTLGFVGWYYTLDWVTTQRSDVSKEISTAQVVALIGTSAPGIGAVNPFLSTSSANIVSSGLLITRKIEQDTTYRAKIEQLLSYGNGSERYAWGVYENRAFYADVWKGANPSTAQYVRYIGDGRVYDAVSGGVVPPWRVRPNAMVLTPDLLDLSPAGADAAARFFCERVTCRVGRDGMQVELEPEAANSADARLAYYTQA